MPKTENGKVLVAIQTNAQRYALLTDDEKRELRGKMISDGCSKSSFHRWLSENAMPKVWQQRFNENYNAIINTKP